jgi:hypothetical protein
LTCIKQSLRYGTKTLHRQRGQFHGRRQIRADAADADIGFVSNVFPARGVVSPVNAVAIAIWPTDDPGQCQGRANR